MARAPRNASASAAPAMRVPARPGGQTTCPPAVTTTSPPENSPGRGGVQDPAGLRGEGETRLPPGRGGEALQPLQGDAQAVVEVRRGEPGHHQALAEDLRRAQGHDPRAGERRDDEGGAQACGDQHHDPAPQRHPGEDGPDHPGYPDRRIRISSVTR